MSQIAGYSLLQEYLSGQLATQKDQYTIIRAEFPKTTSKHWATNYKVQVASLLVTGPKGLMWVEALCPVDLTEAMGEHGEVPLMATVRKYRGTLAKVSFPVYIKPGAFPASWHALTDLLGDYNK